MALNMMQTMAIWETGKCKCPVCGKYRKETDFPDQPSSVNVNNERMHVHVHLEPRCYKCLG